MRSVDSQVRFTSFWPSTSTILHPSDIVIVQVDERTDLLGYQLQCGAVPYKPNLRVSKPTTLPVSTTLRRNSVFSQQCTVSHTPPIPNSLWTIANKQSVVTQSTNSRVSSQALFLGLLAFPPWSQTKRTCALQISAGLVPILQTTPFSLHKSVFSYLFLFFFLSTVWLKRRVCPAVGPLLRRLRQLLLSQCLCQSPLKPHVSPATRLRRCRRTSTRRMSTDGLLG